MFNKTTTTTTTIRALLPAITTTRAARIAAAHARHPIPTTAAIVPLYDHYDPQRDAREIISAAAWDTYTCTAARYRTSGQDIMRRLRAAIPHDLRRMSIADKAAAERAARKTGAAARKAALTAARIAASITTDSAERDEAAALVTALHNIADDELGEAGDIARYIDHSTHTDTADIIQTAALQRLEDLHSTGAQDKRSSMRAAGQHINSIAAAQGCTATRTKVEPITAAQLDALRAKWPMYCAIDPDNPIKIDRLPVATLGHSTAYISVEYRNSDRFPAGYYKITHYTTVSPLRLDDYAKGAKDDDRTTLAETMQELATHDISDADRDHQPQLDALISAANLTERDRRILATATGDNPRNVAAGIRAVAAHMARADAAAAAADNSRKAAAIRSNAAKRAEIIRQRARLAAAMHTEGITTDAAQRKAKSRIKARLSAAMIAAPYWAILDSAPTGHADPAPVVDLLAWTDRQTADPAPMIKWTRRTHPQETQTISTPAQREQDAITRRAAEIAAYEHKQAAAAAKAAAVTAATARADDYFPKPAAASAAVFIAAEHARREDVFTRSYDRWEAAQKRRNAAQDAQQTTAAEERRNRYNAALRAALEEMGVTWQTATPAQRQQATAAAQTARG